MLDKYIDVLESGKGSDALIGNTRWIVGHLLQRCEDLGVQEVNPKVLRATTIHYFGVDIADASTSHAQATIRSAVARYWSFCNTGEATYPSVLYPVNSPARFREVFCEFCDFIDSRQFTISTKRSHKDLAMGQLRYFEARGVEDLRDLTPEDFRSFVCDTYGDGKEYKVHDSCKAKSFIDWLSGKGVISFDSADAFPYGFGQRIPSRSIPSHYSADELKATFAAVDRTTAKGKRDYLVMCLTGLLGMRVGDVVDLRLKDIDWATGKIAKAQCKTGHALSLPLIKPVEEALRDYLDNARPECEDDHVVVRMVAPYTGYTSVGVFTRMVTDYMLNAGVDISGRHHGTHCLRHSTAGGLLSEGASVSEVAAILGHGSARSTKRYLALDATRMRALGLEVPDVSR